jgi:hypothetical protein
MKSFAQAGLIAAAALGIFAAFFFAYVLAPLVLPVLLLVLYLAYRFRHLLLRRLHGDQPR